MGRKKVSSQTAESPQKDQPENSGRLDRAKSILETTNELANFCLFRREGLQNTTPKIRRSMRIQNTTLSGQNQNIEPVVQEIAASESEEEDHPYVDRDKRDPEFVLGTKSLEEKINHILELLEAREKTTNALQSKGCCMCFPSQKLCAADIRFELKRIKYKSMYIDSQKKIEELRDENCQLSKKLEYALGKLEVYEKGVPVTHEATEKLKETVIISSLLKTAEMVLSHPLSGASTGGLTAVLAETGAPVPRRRKPAKSGKITGGLTAQNILAETGAPVPRRRKPAKSGAITGGLTAQNILAEIRAPAPRRRKPAKSGAINGGLTAQNILAEIGAPAPRRRKDAKYGANTDGHVAQKNLAETRAPAPKRRKHDKSGEKE